MLSPFVISLRAFRWPLELGPIMMPYRDLILHDKSSHEHRLIDSWLLGCRRPVHAARRPLPEGPPPGIANGGFRDQVVGQLGHCRRARAVFLESLAAGDGREVCPLIALIFFQLRHQIFPHSQDRRPIIQDVTLGGLWNLGSQTNLQSNSTITDSGALYMDGDGCLQGTAAAMEEINVFKARP
jgi:hypothetical protein